MRIQRRVRDAKRREVQDRAYIKTFIDAILDQYPGCPSNTAKSIAKHACLKHSRRVGRSAAAKKLDNSAVRLAVIAHVRHAETNYDELLTITCTDVMAEQHPELAVAFMTGKGQF